MADISWIKLSVNLFDDEKIKLIRSMPEGDSILLIWIQLLCLAGKTNDEGAVYMGQHMYYTDEMLATICNIPLGVVRIALKTFHEFNMIDINKNGLIQIENWEKHQSTDKLSKIKKQGRDRKRKYDLRKALREYGIDPDGEDIPSNLDDLEEYVNNVNVTLRNETEVRSKKLEDRSKKLEDRSTSTTFRSQVVEAWNTLEDAIPNIQAINPNTKRYDGLRARTSEYGESEVLRAISNIKDSSFLRGSNKNNWIINFDWFIKPNNFLKVLEGNYKDKQLNDNDHAQSGMADEEKIKYIEQKMKNRDF